VLWGGRGSGKSHIFAGMMVANHIERYSDRSLCVREVQRSIKDSVHQLLMDKISDFQANYLFTSRNGEIHRNDENRDGEQPGQIVFRGMNSYNADSIKSMEGQRIAWVEEAQALSERSLKLLRPTIRLEDSELWFSFNARFATDPVDRLFRGPYPPPNAFIRQMNYTQNPWFPNVLEDERQTDKGNPEADYHHIWEGAYEKISVGAYYAKQLLQLEQRGHFRELKPSPGCPLHTAMDIGVGDSTAIWFFQIVGDQLWILDYYESTGMGVGHYNDVINEKAEEMKLQRGWDLVPHDATVRVWTDTSKDTGRARQRIEIMKDLGMNPKVVTIHKIDDGISAVRETLKIALFDRHATGTGVDFLRRYRADWDEERQVLRPRPVRDQTTHAADAFRYLAMGWRFAIEEPPPPKGRTIDDMSLDDLWELQEAGVL
jgi:phage terminase large subunit